MNVYYDVEKFANSWLLFNAKKEQPETLNLKQKNKTQARLIFPSTQFKALLKSVFLNPWNSPGTT